MRTLKTARSFSNGRIRVYCEIFSSPRLTLKSVVKHLEKDLRECSPRACAVPFSVPHRLTATDGQESEWCTQTKNTGTNEQIYLPGHTQENFETAQALLCVRICESAELIKHLFGYLRVFSFSFWRECSRIVFTNENSRPHLSLLFSDPLFLFLHLPQVRSG